MMIFQYVVVAVAFVLWLLQVVWLFRQDIAPEDYPR